MLVEIYDFCTGCKEQRLLEDFAVNPSRPSGRSGWCKFCHRADGVKRRQDPEYRERQAHQAKIWRETPFGRELHRLSAARERTKFPEKVIARRKVRDAVAAGRLKRLPCFCGESKTEAHHQDYSKPLEVEWLCPKHHAALRKSSLCQTIQSQ